MADSPTILVVEDEEAIRFVLQEMLSKEGFRVVSTSDPTEAPELARNEAPDLILSDISMPQMDGFALLNILQSDPQTARYPVVFLTAHRGFSERVRAFRFGVVDYLTKPFTREVLVTKLRKVLESRSRRQGILSAGPDMPPEALLEAVRQESRSGVLTVPDEDGGSRVVIQAGAVVEKTPLAASQAVSGAAFEELDATREDIVAHDPATLPGNERGLPDFDAIPEVLRDVLVVDDNTLFRRFLHDLLSSKGLRVHQAIDGNDGLAKALEKRPSLILTDVRMPGCDGFEFCRRVRSHTLIRQTPLLFLSGWDDYKQRYYGLELGADDFISKETSIRELLIRIQLLMKRYTDLGQGRKEAGMQGDLQVMGAPGVLQVCHLTRLTGLLSVVDGQERAKLRFKTGEIVAAECGSAHGEEAVHEFLAWDSGRFEFTPSEPGPESPLGEGFEHLLLEGCRRLDERRRGSS